MQACEFGEHGYPTILVISNHTKMQVCEFGEHGQPTVLFISDQTDKEILRAQLCVWENKYHLIAPVFRKSRGDGQSVEEKADLIAQYIRSRYQGAVYAICGCESSWPVMNRLLEHAGIRSQKTIVETDGNEPGHFMEQMLQHA